MSFILVLSACEFIWVLRWQVVSENGSKCAINVEESSSSFKSWSTNTATKSRRHSRSLSNDLAVEPEFHSGSKCDTVVSGKQNGVAHPITHHSQDDVSSTVTT